ncbi:MAG TPA: hypothetical protein VMV31_02925 [Terriglobales bacterium]|nr:hypothetical protein [Terriglobales bacterium]
MPDSNEPNDELAVLGLVASRLEEAGIAYMVTGSVAAAFYAQPRMTRDLDLVLELRPNQLATITSLFAEDFLLDEAGMRAAVERQSMFNLIHSAALVKVDIIVRKDAPYRREEFRRRRRMQVAGQAIWAVAAEDLILSKLAWAKAGQSELQLRDVRMLLGSATGLDMEYLERWAAELGVAGMLQTARTR